MSKPVKRYEKLLVWGSENIEEATVQQAAKASRLPFVEGHVALMPDAHVGKGSTVGSVIPTKGAIIPAAVGVDIGCGMIARRLPLPAEHLPNDLSRLHSLIAKSVPAGVGKQFDSTGMPHAHSYDSWRRVHSPGSLLSNKQEQKAAKQLGTLGSGNHFVEICLDEDDTVWIVLHSGSRGIGNELAQMHIQEAKYDMKQHFITLEDPDLAYFVQDTEDFNQYVNDMLWCQSYAWTNRIAMMDAVVKCMHSVAGFDAMTSMLEINCHHNYTVQEHHHGKNLWITRKGAVSAAKDQLGIIPGSMGTETYIVRGLGNAASYHSCAHGAGRRMSRSQAKKTLDTETLEVLMDGKTWNEDSKALIDEDPRAYKDIDDVMDAQSDLVTIEHRLTQILNYKGA